MARGRKRMPRVLVLLGSPRKRGNSALLAEKIASGAKKAGAKIETVYLHGLKILPCESCFYCQKPRSKGCSIEDDMQPLFRKMVEADAWVIASPVYWFNMSAQTKLWMDRTLALSAYMKEPFTGKRIAIAMSYGGEDPFDSGCINALRTFQDRLPLRGGQDRGDGLRQRHEGRGDQEKQVAPEARRRS